jgi:hypothetical protein
MSKKMKEAVDSGQGTKLVGYGVDTLILNMRYTDREYQPIKQELAEDIAGELDDLQEDARKNEMAMVSPWSFLGVPLFVEPHGAGRQWRWLLTCRFLILTVSRGTFNDILAQVRFSSEFLWTEAWAGDALSKVHEFLISIFGEYIHLQVSEIHLCADLVDFDFSQVNYEDHFVTRVRKNDAMYSTGVDGVTLDYHRVSTLRFSSHGSPLSCSIYNKTLEIKQKSGKTWFHDLWRKGVEGAYGGTWDGESDVWRVEFRFKRDFLHNLTTPIEDAYDLLNHFRSLWEYAAGRIVGGDEGLPDGWLRYALPSETDTTRSRWPVHPAWVVVQAAFTDDLENGLGPVVRQRIREKNLVRGVASTMGYVSTLAAWLGGDYVAPDADASLTLQWLYEAGIEYLDTKGRDFVAEVRRKQKRYGSEDEAREVLI